MGREDSTYTIEVASESPEAARDKIYSQLGSRHRVERRYVNIDEVVEISGDEITDGAVKHHLVLAEKSA